jgi:type II secretory pathway pseudopilin PulG
MLRTPLHSPHRCATPRSHGIMLLGLLISLALGSIGLMAMVDNWALERQRQREQDLLFVGDQYRQAIRRYYFGAPAGQARQLPLNLEALLEDERYPMPMRYLRRLYPDPITGSSEWGEVRMGDRLVGVYSKSEAAPIKRAGFAPAYDSFKDKESYQDWAFVFTVPGRASVLPTAAVPIGPVRRSPPKP